MIHKVQQRKCWRLEKRMNKSVAAISKAQKAQSFQDCKMGDPLGFLSIQFVETLFYKIEGGSFGDIKKFSKNKKLEFETFS